MWIARDPNGNIYLYRYKPEKTCNYWKGQPSCLIREDVIKRLIPLPKWEDKEPIKIKIVII
ncbi:MAG: hypothetical protein NC344_05680 [Bacteroidales bacterium]|nr:hypothetical protein [Bacteroidales bacterium]MCM1147310.1 hypothetical protein [Bacteroidales bacterium]MCM1206256.1 hypothetical protein [Bacillota bacterium]